jgi:hypothetical protein
MASGNDLQERIQTILQERNIALKKIDEKDKIELQKILDGIMASNRSYFEDMDNDELLEYGKDVFNMDFSSMSKENAINYILENDEELARDIEREGENFIGEYNDEKDFFDYKIIKEKMNWAEGEIVRLLKSLGFTENDYSIHDAGTGSKYIYIFGLETTIRISDHKQPPGGGVADPMIGTTYGESDYHILVDSNPNNLNFYNETDLKDNILKWRKEFEEQ